MYFAEFLNADSSVRLRILSSPTCVGLRYGLHMPVLQRLFLGTTTTHTSLCRGIARSQLPSVSGFPWRLLRLAVSSGTTIARMCFALCVIPSRDIQRCGNIHPLPIGYGFRPRLRGRLTLGQITFTLETLGFRRTGISPVFSLLMPAFSLAPRPRALAGPASSAYAMLSYRRRPRLRPAASVARLAPLHYRRTTTRPVSCYALFEGVAASEPTSWLSVQSYFLSHSARLGDLSRRSGLFPSRRRPLSAAV